MNWFVKHFSSSKQPKKLQTGSPSSVLTFGCLLRPIAARTPVCDFLAEQASFYFKPHFDRLVPRTEVKNKAVQSRSGKRQDVPRAVGIGFVPGFIKLHRAGYPCALSGSLPAGIGLGDTGGFASLRGSESLSCYV